MTIDAAIIPLTVIVTFGICFFKFDNIKESIILPWFIFYTLVCAWSFLFSYLLVARANRDVVLENVRKERKWAEDRKNGKT